MAHRGVVEDVLGHISLRVDAGHALVRCRGPLEAGLRFTAPSDIRLVALDTGAIVDDPAAEYSVPGELPIHVEVLAARPDVSCVVHAHPPDVVIASLAEVPLEPLFGAYNIPAMRLAAQGIPVYPRSVLVRNAELGRELVLALGAAPVAVLKGHGVVSTGASVPEAVLRALHLDTLARITLGVHQAGATPVPIPHSDMVELPDLGAGFNETTLWRHHLAALDASGGGIEPSPEDTE